MVRIILGVISGFLVWSVLWVGSDALIAAFSPDWYGKSLMDFQKAVENKTPYTVDTTILIMSLIRSFIFSIISGFVAAWIARESTKTTLALGILLLLFGIFIQSVYWSYIPLWYHLIFLILLIPLVVLGGKLKKQSQTV